MNKFFSSLFGVVACAALISACSTASDPSDTSATNGGSRKDAQIAATTCGPNPYTVAFLGEVPVGPNWQWTWSITNPNPGNGSNNTVQGLSHFSVAYGAGECEMQPADVVSASFSYDGINYIPVNAAPFNDPAYRNTNCPDLTAVNAIKFDFGTTGGTPIYFRIVVNKDFDPVAGVMGMTWKSGINTGCGCSSFTGMGCDGGIDGGPEGCSWSQGFYFASPVSVWTSVTVGGHSYTYAEGRAIFRLSNKGGIAAAKKAFLQVAAIKLSGGNVLPTASVWADVAICESYLSGLAMITASNYNTGSFKTNAAASNAAGRIGEWIELNHCE